MYTECILITREGPIVEGIGSGDSVDFIRTATSGLPGIKAFCIGSIPEKITGKRIRIYIEDERVYKVMTQGWK